MNMHGYGRYQVLGAYWCSLCGTIHHQRPSSEESIMKTAWTTVDGKHYNVGFCNGVHTNPDAPKHLAKRNMVASEVQTITTEE